MGIPRKSHFMKDEELRKLPSIIPPKWNSHFWGNEKYTQFATRVPSNWVGYTLLHSILGVEGKILLDFGCYRGDSTKTLLDAGAKKAVGVDKFKKNVYAARKRHEGDRRLQFLHVGPRAQIPQKRYYEGASMTFVRPAISTHEELGLSFEKIFNALRRGAPLGIIGLHPNSLKPGRKFVYYGHSLPPGEKYKDGAKFENVLRLPDEMELRFSDCCWTEKTIVSTLENAGFAAESVFGIKWSELPGRLQATFKGAKNAIAKHEGIKWLDEWKAPLYQIFHAVKR